jgi:hypothetical protein
MLGWVRWYGERSILHSLTEYNVFLASYERKKSHIYVRTFHNVTKKSIESHFVTGKVISVGTS